MKLTELECPNCGASIDDLSQKVITCRYCGSTIYNPSYEEKQQQTTNSTSTSTSTNSNTQDNNGYGVPPIIPIIRIRPPHGRPPMGGGRRPPMGGGRGGRPPMGGGRGGRGR